MMTINFSGITQAASDHDCKDGEMSILMNLLLENGTLIPLTTDESGDDTDPAAERQRWSERCGMNVNAVAHCGRLICLVGDEDIVYGMIRSPHPIHPLLAPPFVGGEQPREKGVITPVTMLPLGGDRGGLPPNDQDYILFRRDDLLYNLDIDQRRQDLTTVTAAITDHMIRTEDEEGIKKAVEEAAERALSHRSQEWHKDLVLGVAVMRLFDGTPLFVSNIFALAPAELEHAIHIDATNLTATSDIYLHAHRAKVTLRRQTWQQEEVSRLIRSVDFYLSQPLTATAVDSSASSIRATIDAHTFRHAQSITPDRFGQDVMLPRPVATAEALTLDDLRRHTHGAKVAQVYENCLCIGQVCTPPPSPFGPAITYRFPTGAQGLCGILPDDDGVTPRQADTVARVTMNIQGQTQTVTFRQQMPYPIGGPLIYPDRRAISMEVLLRLDNGNDPAEYWRKTVGMVPSTIGNWAIGLWSDTGGGHTSGNGTLGSLLWQQVAEMGYDEDTHQHVRRYALFESIDEATFTAAAAEAGQPVEGAVEGNLLLTSMPSRPMEFPADKAVRIGNGDITAISSNTRRFSGVQFGAYPLYVFTTEGIWALQRGTGDGWRSKYLVTHATTTQPDHLVATYDAVLFFNDEGLMSVSGNQLSCLWEGDLRAFAETTRQLPRFNEIVAAIFPADTAQSILDAMVLPTVGHRLTFHGQRVFWQLSESLSMVFSLKSKQWGCLLHDDTTAEGVPVLALTRPMHLGDGHQRKRVTEWLSCGLFHGSRTLDESALRMVVWGSNDLYNWQLVATSRTHFITGICGTPYRHYRVLVGGWLQHGESIKGLSLPRTPSQ